MKMTFRRYGSKSDSVTLQQIPGMTGLNGLWESVEKLSRRG